VVWETPTESCCASGVFVEQAAETVETAETAETVETVHGAAGRGALSVGSWGVKSSRVPQQRPAGDASGTLDLLVMTRGAPGRPPLAGRPRAGEPAVAAPTPDRSPRTDAIADRVIGTLRRGCPDHLIAWDERHPRAALAGYVDNHNPDRPHRTLGLETPPPATRPLAGAGAVTGRPVLGGLHHTYARAA
jgi:hypothetical protein